MTQREIELVRRTFFKVAPMSDQVVVLFYTRLFELDPTFRGVCRGGMEEQGRRLVRTAGGLMALLEQLGREQPVLRRFGRRQSRRGLRLEHYPTAGLALLWALERALGAEFTPAVKAAWAHFYLELAGAMSGGEASDAAA